MKKTLFSKRMWLMLIATLLIFGGVLGMQWYGGKKMNEFMDNMPVQTVTVTAAEAGSAQWRSELNSVGTLVAIRGAELATEVPGTVENILFDNGAMVQAGDIIMTLNSAPDRAELKALEAAQELAAIEMRRAKKLLDQRNISKSELDQRASQLDQARARVAAQQARIDQKTLRAPYSGRLGIRRFNVGDYVRTGDTIIELQALDRLYVNFSLPEQYSRQIKVGMTVTTRVQALDNEAFEGVITAISPIIDRDTRNVSLQATLDNREDMLRPGMFARLSLPLGDATEQVVVPQTAIAYRPYGNSVYVIQGEGEQLSVSQRFVTLGDTRGDMIAIEKGLEPGERIVTSALLKLDSGVPIKIDNTIQPNSSLTPQPDNG
ncbi:efflux RND transporter periplasmic adaptor subunit [Parahaliea sp. F7430]|uniref:Efflux RND transporter periplasmic adaptor subunit n=1 Tax=Sediminihaliea albiluteola TaxID=2758564 RepID=A0A7W2TXT8_9GAMM|nr:efflux RND transporter periplasmic adaptor subunit [Sediminihaliea albiluteola]MBA6413897.1 efflux RND transporter periplasmic adaptor subunit [Sediminihaliea albiluteola]